MHEVILHIPEGVACWQSFIQGCLYSPGPMPGLYGSTPHGTYQV